MAVVPVTALSKVAVRVCSAMLVATELTPVTFSTARRADAEVPAQTMPGTGKT